MDGGKYALRDLVKIVACGAEALGKRFRCRDALGHVSARDSLEFRQAAETKSARCADYRCIARAALGRNVFGAFENQNVDWCCEKVFCDSHFGPAESRLVLLKSVSQHRV